MQTFLFSNAYYSDRPRSPDQSDPGSPDSNYDSSDDEDVPEAIRRARAREKRFQVGTVHILAGKPGGVWEPKKFEISAKHFDLTCEKYEGNSIPDPSKAMRWDWSPTNNHGSSP